MSRLYYGRFKDDNSVISKIIDDNNPPKIYADCYSDIGLKFNINTDETFYSGFYANERILKLIDEINNNFKNIKINVAYFGIQPFESISGVYLAGKVYRPHSFPDGNCKEFTYIIFNVSLDDVYTFKSKYMLTLILSEFIRGFNPEYICHSRVGNVDDDFINNMLALQSTTDYGDWMCMGGKNSTTREFFDKLDDYETINEICKGLDTSDMPIISVFFETLEGRFDIGKLSNHE